MPNQPEVADTLGWIYYRQGAHQLAIRHFEQAARQQPASPVYRFHLGLARLKAGDTAGARDALKQAVEANRPFEGLNEARRTLAGLDDPQRRD